MTSIARRIHPRQLALPQALRMPFAASRALRWLSVFGSLVVSVACGSGSDSGTLPQAPVESGFVVANHAFHFKNFGGRDPNARVTPDSASRMFGAQAVCANVDTAASEGCRLTPIAKSWMQRVNDAMEGGRCEGFAVLSGLLFLDKVSVDTLGASSVRELELEDNQALAREIAYWFSTQYLVDVIDEATRPMTATEAVRFLAQELAEPTEMYRIGIMRIDEQGRRRGGHAILPVAVVPGEAGTYRIKVYDNNFPDEERELLVDTQKNRWEYQASSNPDEPLSLYWGSPENGNLMFLSAVTPRLGTHACQFCEGDEGQQAQALAQVFTLGSAEVVAEVDGAHTGIVDGRVVEGIEGAKVPPMFTNGDGSAMMLVPVASGLSLTVKDGEGEVPLQVGVYGPGFTAGLNDSVKVGSRADKLGVNADGSDIRFEPSTTSGPSIVMARVTKEGTQTVVTLKLPEGLAVTSVSMQIDPNTGDAGIQARAEGDVPLQVEVTRSSEIGEDTFAAEIVAPAEGAVAIEVSAWEGEGAPMPVGVDHEGTGNFEPTEVVSTGPVGVAPETPTGFAGAFTNGAVALSWTDASTNEESFVVERDAGNGFVLLATLAVNSSGTSDAAVVGGRTYRYRVHAANRYGVSAWSDVVSVRIPGCAPGEQDRDGDGVCAPDCATAGVSCGAHGVCSDLSGTALCVCDTGYTGTSCGTCAAGYQDRDGDGVCAPDCATAGVSCGAHGVCSDLSGTALCVCDTGYTGTSCGACDLDFQDNDGDGICAPNCAASGVNCGNHGACSDLSGTALCVCDTGYTGTSCGTCDLDFQDNDGDGICTPNCATAGVSCGAHGACSDLSGTALCVCDTGYTGTSCATCDLDFQDNDGDGVCTPTCASLGSICGDHGACVDADGTAVCVCDTGHAGTLCDSCDAGYVVGPAGCVPTPARCESSRDCVIELTVPSALELRHAELGPAGLSLLSNTQGFASSGTFTVPAGVTRLSVYALGGGGGGRNDFGQAGQGGSAARSFFDVSPGQVIAFTVGAGGQGGTAPSAGGDTVVTVAAASVVGGGGGSSHAAAGTSVGDQVALGGASNQPGTNLDGVCSAGGGGPSIDGGRVHYRVGAAGGCFPAGAGGHGAPQYDANGAVSQPGGHGNDFGGGGGSGGNYNGQAGNGAGGYVLFSWEATPKTFVDATWGVAAATGLQLDTSSWTGIGRVTPVTDAGADEATFAVSFDDRITYQAFVDGAWRTIARAVSTDGQALGADNTRWQYNAAETGAHFVACPQNTRSGCLQTAFGVAHNRMRDLASLTWDQWALAFVPGTLDVAFGLWSDTPDRSPTITRLDIDLTPPAIGLEHCWTGDGDGTDSYGDLAATVFSDVTFADGVNGQAFVCSGEGGTNKGVAVTANPLVSSQGPWTYDFWIKVEQSNNAWVFDRALPRSPLVSLHVSNTGQASWLIRFDGGHGINSAGFTLDDTWTHVAVTRGDGVLSFYKSGVLFDTKPDPGVALTPDPPKWCNHYGSADQWMLGGFDTVRVWSRALTTEEIGRSAAGNGSCEAH